MLSKNNTQHHTTRQCFSVLSLEITFKKQAWAQESVKTSKHVKTVSMNICASTQLFLFRGDQCQNVQQTAYSGPFWLPDRDLVSKVFMRGCFTATTPSNPHEGNVIQMEFNRTFCHEALTVVLSNTQPIACYSNSNCLRFLLTVKWSEICHSCLERVLLHL